MVATVCLRLAFGLVAPLNLLDSKPIPPRFFRIQLLVSLGLLAVAGYFLSGSQPINLDIDGVWLFNGVGVKWFWIAFSASAVVCFLGCLVWHLDRAPGGTRIIRLASCCLAFVLFLITPFHCPESVDWWRLGDNFASAAMLGVATTAMMLGHSYLISPTMTIAPLLKLLIALAGVLALRVTLATWALYWWTSEHPLGNLETETLLWLIARWVLGILAPLALGWMAWETARIRSTQSATGILYVVVIVTFLGELTSLLLLEKTGYPL